MAARFDSLLTSHLVIAAELVKAAKAGDSRAAADAERRWYANADEIAAFSPESIHIGRSRNGKTCCMNTWH